MRKRKDVTKALAAPKTTGKSTKAAPVAPESTVADPEAPQKGGAQFVIEADALHSHTYAGRVNLGTYSQWEQDKKSRVTKRVEDLKAQGYRNITVREVAA